MFHVTQGSRAESVLAFCIALMMLLVPVLIACLAGGAPAKADLACGSGIALCVVGVLVVVPWIERASQR